MERGKTIIVYIVLLMLLMNKNRIGFCEDYENTNQILYESKLTYIYTSGNGVGFIDKSTGFNSSAVYEAVWDFDEIGERTHEDPILVWKNNMYGYVNRSNGDIVIPINWNLPPNEVMFKYGYAHVGLSNNGDDRYFLLFRDGEKVVFPEHIEPLSGLQNSNGLIILGNRSKKGKLYYGLGIVCEKKISILIDPQYAFVGFYHDGLACFSTDGVHYGFLDEIGDIQIEPIYLMPEDDILEFEDGVCTVLTDDGHEVMIDSKGSIREE